MQIDGVECVDIKLNDIEDENCKIDVFCISEDKQTPGFGLNLVLRTLRKNNNDFLKNLE